MGCGPVGQFAIASAWLQGASRVIAIDRVPERLGLAKRSNKAEVINFRELDVYETLMSMTGGRGPDCCIDAVGAESSSKGARKTMDSVRDVLRVDHDHPYALAEIFKCCRKGGKVSGAGVYFNDLSLPWGTFMNKGLTFRTGQTHTQKYMPDLLERIVRHDIDPTFIITHRVKLDEAPTAYELFRDKKDSCIKVVIKP